MTQAPVPAMPVQPRRPGPGLGISLVVMGAGLVLAIISVILIVLPLLSSFTSPVYTVPGQCDVHLHDARYIVYQRTGNPRDLRVVQDGSGRAHLSGAR